MAKKAAKTGEVSALRMPGFKAETSLYTSTATYRSSGGSGETVGAVQPAVCWCHTPYGLEPCPCKIRAYLQGEITSLKTG
jgi:hypothetical protein